jgi:hypothetical protein
MTKKIAISLPDDIAERVAQEDNASAFIADAIRRRMNADETKAALRDLGFALTDEGLAEAGAEFDALRATVTPELREKAAALRAEGMRRR